MNTVIHNTQFQETLANSTTPHRPRRLRTSPAVRSLVAETRLHVENFVAPLFVCHGSGIRREIAAMPGVYHLSVDELVRECEELLAVGIQSVLLFGVPEQDNTKDECGSQAWNERGIVQRAVRALRQSLPELHVITDVCLCAYTSHGHCGVVEGKMINNDASVELIVKQALSHATAGAQMLAPSDMMDGRIGAVRRALDAHGFADVSIMSYAAKYASAFYGPFREAAHSAPQFGDRSTYQMNPANSREAMREIELDIAEGADIVMIKPALAYLDVIYQAKTRFTTPIAAYNVSGEYAAIKAAAQNGWLDEHRAMMEMLLSIKRAGADIIITYFAKEAARLLQ